MLEVNRSPIREYRDSSKVTYGNPESFLGKAIIAFVDLLGFSASIKTYWGDEGGLVLERLLRIKDRVESARLSPVVVIPNTATAEPSKVEFHHYIPRLHTVSDSIVICSALPSEFSEHIFLNSMKSLDTTLQLLWDVAVLEGFTIRGAVELGEIYWTSAETIGPALIDAYTLESRVARWSRVVYGTQILQELLCSTKTRPHLLHNQFELSSDQLIERPFFRVEERSARYRPLFEAMSKAAGPKNVSKYEPLLSVLRGDRQIHWATRDDITRGAMKIQELLLPSP